MENRHEREQQLTDRISRAILTDAETFAAYHGDLATHARLQLLRHFMLAADGAMRIEGVDRQVRDRVAHWLLFGRPPDTERDPEEQVEAAAWEAIRERQMRRDLADLGLPLPWEE